MVIYDSTGHPSASCALPADVVAQLKLQLGNDVVPPRGENGRAGDASTPGPRLANFVQQNYFKDAAVKVILPMLKAKGKPFVMVFWSRDPDGTQHN